MKRSAHLLLTFTLISILAGCSLFRSQQTGTLFSFEYEGKVYDISGYTNEVGESVNYLTYRDNNDLVFRAVDHHRSGVIDQVVSGSITVKEANIIYQAGIRIAMEQDLYKNIDRYRTFEFKYDDYQLMVETYQKREGEFHNRFVIFDLNWELEASYWDDNSDGTIDRIDTGDLDMDTVQNLYSLALDRAGDADRLNETDSGQIIISKNSKLNNNLAGVSQ